jgi:hypothetical protein
MDSPAQISVQAKPRGWKRRLAMIALRWSIVVALLLAVLRLTGCMEHLFYHPDHGKTPVPRNYPGAESVWFTSADGTKLHGWFIPARDERGQVITDRRVPGILHVHGNAGNISSHAWFTEYLPLAGFSVLVFDYRGYGESEGRARTRGPLIEDANAALDALLGRPDVDPERVGMYGQSLGGAIALNVMAARPQIKCAVFESSFSSWQSIAACVLGGDPPNLICRMLASILISDSHRPVDAIAKVQAPVLLVHGTDDRISPVSHSRALKEAGGENVELVEIPRGDHNTLRDTNPEIEELVIQFFRSHLESR